MCECSLNDCGDMNHGSMNWFNGGKINISSANISFCYAETSSALRITDIGTGNAQFSSFCNTKASEMIFYFDQSNFDFKFCNVLNNVYQDNDVGTLTASSSSEISIDSCSFLGNQGPNSDFHSMTVYNYFDIKNTYCDRNIDIYGEYSTKDIHYSSSTHNLSHYSTCLCEAKFPINDIDTENKKFTKNGMFNYFSRRFVSSLRLHLSKQ